MCHVVASMVVDIVSLVLIHEKEKLCECGGDNAITRTLFDILFYLLQSDQSEEIKLRALAALRTIINKYMHVFLSASSTLFYSSLCLEVTYILYIHINQNAVIFF